MRRCVSSGGLSTLLTPRVAEDREQGAKPCAPYRGPDTLMTTLYSHQCADRCASLRFDVVLRAFHIRQMISYVAFCFPRIHVSSDIAKRRYYCIAGVRCRATTARGTSVLFMSSEGKTLHMRIVVRLSRGRCTCHVECREAVGPAAIRLRHLTGDFDHSTPPASRSHDDDRFAFVLRLPYPGLSNVRYLTIAGWCVCVR